MLGGSARLRSNCSGCSASKRQGSDRDFIAFTRNHGQRAAAGVAQPKVVKLLGVAVCVVLHYKQSSITKALESSRTRGICAFLYHKTLRSNEWALRRSLFPQQSHQ